MILLLNDDETVMIFVFEKRHMCLKRRLETNERVHNVNNVNDNSWSVSVLSNERDKRMRNS
jgi:hypothetical protein